MKNQLKAVLRGISIILLGIMAFLIAMVIVGGLWVDHAPCMNDECLCDDKGLHACPCRVRCSCTPEIVVIDGDREVPKRQE
jgi:hypothetical protein